jgi:hypothetical protein
VIHCGREIRKRSRTRASRLAAGVSVRGLGIKTPQHHVTTMTGDDSEPLMHNEHGVPIYPEALRCVPIEELEALADDMEDPTIMHHSDAFINQKRWAQELREVIEQYE